MWFSDLNSSNYGKTLSFQACVTNHEILLLISVVSFHGHGISLPTHDWDGSSHVSVLLF
jgi:hypothetical protein